MSSKIEIKNPIFSLEFNNKIVLANRKGVSVISKIISSDKKRDLVMTEAYCNGRIVGRAYFQKIKNICSLVEKLTIESEFYPIEVCILYMSNLLKDSKVKYLTF